MAALGNHPNLSNEDGLNWIRANWSESMLPYFTESYRFGGGSDEATKLNSLLKGKIGREAAGDFDALNQYIWGLPLENTPDYARFKQWMHYPIDKRFARYFEPDRRFDIRLDEVSWGGVYQDGIPPLRQPQMLTMEKADYLDDSNVVFGIEINGDARAYPNRILAWHEMFVDTVGGVPIAGVYCTLCGTVVIYQTEHEGTNHELGTSGFLYRSNKLMYDRATQSLWSTLEGKPVIGPLTGKGIELDQYSVVTTTWGEWKSRHPDTKVLSLNTGHQRNYDEGNAYRAYFATDDRMFETPYQDNRLKNKDEVLALRFGDTDGKPTVIATGLLKSQPVYEGELSGHSFVILTDGTGANRVYERPKELRFDSWDQKTTATDSSGQKWNLSEASLISPDGTKLKRLNAHRAFWFGWHGAYPNTILIQ